MISVNNLTYAYGEVETLRGVDLELPQGAILALMGRNGVGKTTFLKCLMGLLRAQGSIHFDGLEINGKRPSRRASGGLGYVPQGRQIFPRLTVEENLKLALAAAGKKDRVQDFIYEEFPVLAEMRSRQGGNLSGGQQQQLAIGRALVTRPNVLVLDEPTEGIQPNIIDQIGDLLQRLVAEQDLTVLVVEQYLDWVRAIGSHFAIMNRGRVVAKGGVAELSDDIVQEFLGV